MLKKICTFVLLITVLFVQKSFSQAISMHRMAATDSLWDANLNHIISSQRTNSAHTVRLQRRHDEHHHEGLHFAHPLFTESVSPDTKFRFDYNYQNMAGNVKRNGLVLGGEYAFDRSFSIEVGLPYEFLNPGMGGTNSRVGNMEVSFKFANYAFEDSGLLLGYGLEFGLPTGRDRLGIGSDHILEVAPFLNAGLKKGAWEWVGFATFGIPTNQNPGEGIETELELNASALYHVSERWQGLLELNGSSPLSGGEEAPAWFLSPGFKLAPLQNEHLKAGVGVQIPLSKDQEQKLGLIGSLFYHFH